VLQDGKPYMVFGTPGGDQQDQWTLQFFLNFVDFGMGLQEAIDAANFYTDHCPSSFYPRRAKPGSLTAESRISETTCKELAQRGHKVTSSAPWSGGLVMAVHFGPQPGVLCGGVSPRGMLGYVTED
jgi:gamma-glutamyltranspeptidase/glutathione hydrolase